jgi:hypothetical protein
MCDAVHSSTMMMIIRIVLYKDHFDVYVTNAGDITIRIFLNRRDVSRQDRRIPALRKSGAWSDGEGESGRGEQLLVRR